MKHVAVYTLNPDGSYAYDPVVVEVPYRRAVRRPYKGQTLWIHLDDETEEGCGAAISEVRRTPFGEMHWEH